MYEPVGWTITQASNISDKKAGALVARLKVLPLLVNEVAPGVAPSKSSVPWAFVRLYCVMAKTKLHSS
ncbi:hypothetical protein LWM68_20930 [Niabella sp. W65]|nr:hypothetical protein [Niabella sp. W65]MCH7365006.1 hypothetical protein [Niabella sp. W65]ULT40826.1 hypothetical protein KRR40_39825 [Niabella sp. I65]